MVIQGHRTIQGHYHKISLASSSNPYHNSIICICNSNNVCKHVHTLLVPYRYRTVDRFDIVDRFSQKQSILVCI
jgi:hypothetical protein